MKKKKEILHFVYDDAAKVALDESKFFGSDEEKDGVEEKESLLVRIITFFCSLTNFK